MIRVSVVNIQKEVQGRLTRERRPFRAIVVFAKSYRGSDRVDGIAERNVSG